MSTLLAEPFLLASYATSSHKQRSEQRTRSRHVNATFSRASNGEGFVTVTIQGDGVHVLELSNMHASVSHTLGPSASFAAPAVTRFEDSGESTSYAVMQSVPDGIDSAERGRTVWRWRDRQSKSPEPHLQSKISAVFPHLVDYIWAPSALPSHIITVSPFGQIMLADQDLNITSTGRVAESGGILLRCCLFQSEECTFLPRGEKHVGGVAVLCFISKASRLKLQVTLVHPVEAFGEPLECDMGLYENVADISCDPSGYASVLTQKGEWKLFRLNHEHTGIITAAPFADTLHLSGVAFGSPSNGGNCRKDGPALLSVGSSHVLLAGITSSSSPEIIILLWDLQFSVVLASQTISLPSTMTYSPKTPACLELIFASRQQVLLVMSPAGSQRKEGATQSRSAVFVVPLEVPSVSTIALAMGKARETQKWLTNTHKPTIIEKDDPRSQMMQSVRRAVEQGRIQAAEAAFFAWVRQEASRLKHAQDQELSTKSEIHPGDDEERQKREHKRRKKDSRQPALSHQFVSSMLNIVLQPKHSEVHSSRIALYLMDRKAVGSGMIEGGLIPALRKNKDWKSIYSALRNVSDIPEADLIELLAEVVKSRGHHDSQEIVMQVDTPAGIPSLAQFLAALVDYTTSPSTLRLALKQHLTDVRDVVRILEVLEEWVAEWCRRSLNWELDTEIPVLYASQAAIKRNVKPLQDQGIPSFQNVISFLQSVLDTYFLDFLQYSACHDILERLIQHLKQQLTSIDEIDRLRGPLESFVRKEAKEALLRRTQMEGDRRKKHKEDAEPAVGVYQIEELVI